MTIDKLIAGLTSKNDTDACALAEKIISESRETDVWYHELDSFAVLLSHKKSLVRNRAIHILAANVRWDTENRFDPILPEFLAHLTDEKPITARQCIKALAQIGREKPRYIPLILESLLSADLSKYKDTMRPLIEKDIVETEELLKQALKDMG